MFEPSTCAPDRGRWEFGVPELIGIVGEVRIALVLASGLLVGCQAGTVLPASPATSAAAASLSPTVVTATHTASVTAKPSTTSATKALTGKVIVIDPGHNAIWTRKLLQKVPSGNGRTKACNSSGTATNDGFGEHSYNWAQAKALSKELRSRGAKVIFTRPDDQGQGPCINLRAAAANTAKADALISIHADGNLSRGARGFHIITSPTMLGGSKVEARSVRLAKKLRTTLETKTTMPRSTYIGGGTGLDSRTDLGTLNLSQRTGVLLEMGNMRNAKDAALLKSADFRAKAAKALAAGIQSALVG